MIVTIIQTIVIFGKFGSFFNIKTIFPSRGYHHKDKTVVRRLTLLMGFLCHKDNIWVRSWNWGCLVTWFCYQLIAKPDNKTAAVPWPDPYTLIWRCQQHWTCTMRSNGLPTESDTKTKICASLFPQIRLSLQCIISSTVYLVWYALLICRYSTISIYILSLRPTVANSCTNQCKWHRLWMEAIFFLQILGFVPGLPLCRTRTIWYDDYLRINANQTQIKHELIRCSEMQ